MSELIDLFRLDISLHGWIALGLTAVGVTGLHLGLMHLVRRRHDPDPDPDPDDDDGAGGTGRRDGG